MVEEARARRAQKTKQPWVVLKLTVGIASAVIAYTCYVYIGRLCIPMIKREASALGGRVLGIVFLVVFILLAFMMIWAYIKVVFTPPGYAVDYVDKGNTSGSGPGPLPQPATSPSQYPPSQRDRPKRTPSRPRDYKQYPSDLKFDEALGAFYAPKPQRQNSHSHSGTGGSSESSPPTTAETGGPRQPASLAAPQPEKEKPARPQAARAPSSRRTVRPAPGPETAHHIRREGVPMRNPPTVPILLPEHRYCRRCQIVKPPRTHHCRSCGTCVLKYDHHCPWIGQCVGAHNQKFFVTFVVWTALFCIWTIGTLIGLNAHASSRPSFSVDPQKIVVIALSGLFALFTIVMFLTHTSLISMNQTTVENISVRSMKQRESEMLGELYPWWNVSAKRRTKKQWDAEWGRIGFEGNLWWTGDVRKHWKEALGPNPWTWFLPVGRSPSDGLHFDRNPRFDREGRWLPRSEWPPELRS
ncbi:zf-DHHC-domain-containing protein [Auriscalpium vulgare]|uniref:Zf-DHHC-domain-containing protein n=1 Tax=Auriscalpium vulgare TaxID=40419 RepID=A0ACB8RGW7_9AGAM|nr:zf-DHHC-domain-containing protein [Auriscalpium vulgare]